MGMLLCVFAFLEGLFGLALVGVAVGSPVNSDVGSG